jgi:DNA-binding protein HU-beta
LRCPLSASLFSVEGNLEGVTVRKQELVRAVAEATKQSDTVSNQAVNAVFSAIEDSLSQGDEVTISGFGSFKVVERSARQGRNPQTGEPMTIGARKSPVFRPGTQLKRAVE